ncbi:hypothetical protein P153DRAFT_370774 [Dothidotthia symphoricarpi CBS 119687]|uniref:Late sexual development protein n=1 Tax=Dothidotthia symphoricarpi CBS 119687 TaxID=1392245 RepID=A0A6A6A143_9PLEO|nr:uncharacterized protein P153DRAFT_370774 [Dothidotthia symphoricarpi CBS 119687]KAF2124874.1 hypothetical protein P153DRAFT_370774 [Dothidotthia symphoricarpi CBS 119687]
MVRCYITYLAALIVCLVSAAPASKREFSPDNVYFPLPNGFPEPSQDQILQIQREAHGTLPNSLLPATLSSEGVTNLKLIALNELFEVAYFTELVYNLTNKVSGYDLGYGHEYVLDSLHAIVAQEQLHLLNANSALEHFKQEPIQPCKYNFPVTDFHSAIALAGTFTDLVLGTLQDIQEIFAKNQDSGLVRGVASVLGNEAEQQGFYRLVQKKRVTSQPFLTTSTRDFAFTAIQSFTIPGSCPNIDTIPLKKLLPLTVETKDIPAATQKLKFSFAENDAGLYNMNSFRLVYINGQNLPIVKNLENLQVVEDRVLFEVPFPYDEFLMNGLTIAAVTMGADQFADADEVSEAAIFGPGLIQIE